MQWRKLLVSIEKMGFKYSVVDYLKTLFMYSMIIIGLSYFHQLEFCYITLLMLTIVLLLPFIIYSQFKFTYEFQRFNDYCLYLKQMTIQYKTHKKIKVALRMTAQAFEKNPSKMYRCILKTVEKIDHGESFEDAFLCIEEEYHNRYIQKLHGYMLLGEQIGGDHVYQALDHVNFEDWQSDVIAFQKQKTQVRKTNIYFTLLSIGISMFCLFFFPQDLMQPLFVNTSFQLLTFIYFEILLMAYALVTCGLTGSWIDEKR